MELNSKEQPSSPQKEGVKARSKSTEEMQPAKKAFHTPQKSLPNEMDGDESKGSSSARPSDASSAEADLRSRNCSGACNKIGSHVAVRLCIIAQASYPCGCHCGSVYPAVNV